MARSPPEPPGRLAVPPPQHNLEVAAAQALGRVRRQPPEQLEWLAARRAGQHWAVPVLDDRLTMELEGGTVRTSAGRPTAPWWRILTLHYLAVAQRPAPQDPAVSFADLPAGRTYAPVYRRRALERLCGTVGRDGRALGEAAAALGGRAAPDGDVGFDFQVYPRVRLRLVWYAGDEELSPSAVLLLPANIESFFCAEDIVVLSERIVSRLGGGRF